jgi:hypothetical protein
MECESDWILPPLPSRTATTNPLPDTAHESEESIAEETGSAIPILQTAPPPPPSTQAFRNYYSDKKLKTPIFPASPPLMGPPSLFLFYKVAETGTRTFSDMST